MQNELNDNIDVCTDSLRRHNKVINGKLRSLMTTMNDQAEQILEDKENNWMPLMTVQKHHHVAGYISCYTADCFLSDYPEGPAWEAEDQQNVGGNHRAECCIAANAQQII